MSEYNQPVGSPYSCVLCAVSFVGEKRVRNGYLVDTQGSGSVFFPRVLPHWCITTTECFNPNKRETPPHYQIPELKGGVNPARKARQQQ